MRPMALEEIEQEDELKALIFGESPVEVVQNHELVLAGPITWPPRMAFDLAMGDDPGAVMARYTLSEEEYLRVLAHPAFRREVHLHIKEVREHGVTFKAKARLQAEEYLLTVDGIITNELVSPATRLDAIKSVVKWAELDGAAAAHTNSTNNPQVNIQINF